MSEDEQKSIIIDPEQGIRVLSPKFIVSREEFSANNVNLEGSWSESMMRVLRAKPDAPLFGSHKSPGDPYEWTTVLDFHTRFTEFGSGLYSELDISPGSASKVGIFGINCTEWVVAHYGLLMYSNVAVPLYSTLGEEAMIHIVNHTKMIACVCFDEDKAKSLIEILNKDLTSYSHTIESLIMMRVKSLEALEKLKQDNPDFKIFTMEEIQAIGRRKIIPLKLPSDKELYIINFTSGTTNVPKGVLITCKMVKRFLHSIYSTRPISAVFSDNDVYYSFLPLAHALEQLTLMMAIFMRARIGFYSGDISKIMTELAVLKPTGIALVPRLLIKIYESTLNNLAAHYIPISVLKFAINWKLKAIAYYGADTETIWDRFLFKKIKNALGGQVRILITGSASCPGDVMDFSRACFGAKLFMAYGSTETCGPVTTSFPNDTESFHVGVPLEGVQIKLTDVPDMNLFPKGGFGRGEICVKSDACTMGYYEDPEKTKDLIDADGWIHMGDVGEWDENGNLRIVDRCKNIFKLCQGEYVAPEKVENIYLTCPLVEQAFLDGRSEHSFAIALIYPNMKALAQKCSFTLLDETSRKECSDGLTMAEVSASDSIKETLLKEMNSYGKSNSLASFEMAKKIHILTEPLSVESGMLTSTLKLVRGVIRRKFESEIDHLYSTPL